ncbi:hypothetical protein DH2020_038075 [Rehmannia glutinosa]|uniref:Uncharacterized protein n=1 Tax=Rehmannia glutinosa TaxID=99300 RepID=A0ABR0V0B5_REHGL
MEMNVPSPNHYEDNGEEDFLDESDIINEYDVDEEELPDADEEGGSDGEEDFGELYTAACSPTDAALVATGGGDDKGFLWKISQGDWAFELQALVYPTGSNKMLVVLDMKRTDNYFTTCFLIKGYRRTGSITPWGRAFLSAFFHFLHLLKHLRAGHQDSVSSLCFSADGQLLASGSLDGVVKVWDIANGELKCTLEGPSGGIEVASKGHLILAGSEDSSVWMWNADRAAYLNVFTGHGNSVSCGDFTLMTDSWRVATGSMDKKLIIWDQDSSPRCICDHEEGVTCLLWLGGSRYIASGCLDGKIRVWDSLSGDCAKIFSGHSDAIQSIAASSNGEFLVSISIDGTARVFEIAEFR